MNIEQPTARVIDKNGEQYVSVDDMAEYCEKMSDHFRKRDGVVSATLDVMKMVMLRLKKPL